ncbi:MAG TPA: hypothetical protein VML54_00995 [Candidatus Limnocylindrales bacterium]|nr:hypothetical protein [Candidatus Limnocylindrales bacterium]
MRSANARAAMELLKYLQSRSQTVTAPATAAVARRDLSATVVATGTIKAVVGAEVKVGSRILGHEDSWAGGRGKEAIEL